MISKTVWSIRCRQFFFSLKKNKLFAYPSESVFALGCFYDNTFALKKLQAFKKNKLKKRLGFVVVVRSFEELLKLSSMDYSDFKVLTQKNHKPLTLVLPLKRKPPNELSSTNSVAIRVVTDPFFHLLLSSVKGQITSSSLNPPNKAPTKNITKARVYCQRQNRKIKLLAYEHFSTSEVSSIYSISEKRYLRF